jgi:hypothetical protein
MHFNSLTRAAALILGLAGLPAAAAASGSPPPAPAFVIAQAYVYPAPPVYYPERREHEIFGFITGAAPFNVFLWQGPHVHLHQGTVINPTGITLQPHMHVAIYGHWNYDGSYHADRIDVLPR